MTDEIRQSDDGPNGEERSAFPLVRRDFVKGGLAASGLIGSASLLGAGVASAASSETTDVTTTAVVGEVDASLSYSNGIQGGSTTAGREGTSDVVGFDWVATGSGAGSRRREDSVGAIFVEKVVDTASPLLYQTMDQESHLSECRLQLYRVEPSGSIQAYYTVVLENVGIESIRLSSVNPLASGTEVIGFVPATIRLEHVDGFEYELTA